MINLNDIYDVKTRFIDILSDMFPELYFLTDYDVNRDVIKIAVLDKTGARTESGQFGKEIIKKFKFKRYHILDDPYKIVDEVSQWCYNYLNPKPEEKPTVQIVEKIVTPHHCQCCGAPMPKDLARCVYCGMEYY